MPAWEREAMLALGRRMDEQPALGIALAERLLRIRDKRGRLLPLRANAAQRCFEAGRGRRNIVLKARQMGITTWVAGRLFLRTITHAGMTTMLVAHTQTAAESIFRTVQRMWEELPEAMRTGPLARRRANVGQMVFAGLDSEFRVGSAADSSVGRGLSLQNLHCSEVSRWPGDAAGTLAGLRAALVPDGELVLESTPSGAYGAFYNEWLRSVEPSDDDGPLVRHFLPWWLEPAYVGTAVAADAMTETERRLSAQHGLSPQQIGFRRQLEQGYGVLRSQEFAEDAETCFRATGSCCFEIESIDRRLAELDQSGERPAASRRGGALQVWYVPQPGREYVLGVDSAGGGEDGDFAAVQVVDVATGLQCAELQERLRPAELARAAAELAREYNGASIAVERNNHGAAVLAYLETAERYPRLWRERGRSGEAGWLTTAASKPEMIAQLGVMLAERPESFHSRRLLSECRTFVSGERGRTGAAAGRHDDLVMAMAIAQRCRVREQTVESRG